MFKKVIVFCLLFLCSCSVNKETSCLLEKEDKSINLDIKAINDDIVSIKETVVFELPNSLIANELWLSDLIAQLNDNYHFDDNRLISETNLVLDSNYSFNKTVEYLRKEKFYCE